MTGEFVATMQWLALTLCADSVLTVTPFSSSSKPLAAVSSKKTAAFRNNQLRQSEQILKGMEGRLVDKFKRGDLVHAGERHATGLLDRNSNFLGSGIFLGEAFPLLLPIGPKRGKEIAVETSEVTRDFILFDDLFDAVDGSSLAFVNRRAMFSPRRPLMARVVSSQNGVR